MKKGYSKKGKLYKGINKLCSKKGITCQRDIEFNGDLHLQFRKKIGYSQSEHYDFYGIEYAECYINAKDLKNRANIFILMDLKGFLNIAFKGKRDVREE